jgi:hypothetical protein
MDRASEHGLSHLVSNFEILMVADLLQCLDGCGFPVRRDHVVSSAGNEQYFEAQVALRAFNPGFAAKISKAERSKASCDFCTRGQKDLSRSLICHIFQPHLSQGTASTAGKR